VCIPASLARAQLAQTTVSELSVIITDVSLACTAMSTTCSSAAVCKIIHMISVHRKKHYSSSSSMQLCMYSCCACCDCASKLGVNQCDSMASSYSSRSSSSYTQLMLLSFATVLRMLHGGFVTVGATSQAPCRLERK
jgi:cytosine/uracil/thiamine/allantoin permease